MEFPVFFTAPSEDEATPFGPRKIKVKKKKTPHTIFKSVPTDSIVHLYYYNTIVSLSAGTSGNKAV